ncbi:alpha/beta hydrolase [Lentilactobacillus buchneri]|nr:alpha/beta hydrolase [Lentilactobacillus buchneri]MDS1016182.1 alpha/beta hydrolase [Lentilactobacillus buchneri]
MKRTVKIWLWSLLAVLLSVGLIVASLEWSHQNVSELTRHHNSQLSPVIMIPGSSATENRFDGLVSEINHNRTNPHSLLKVKITNDDKLHFTGRLRPGDNEPFIVVGFQNNKDGYSNIKQQARQFNVIFHTLVSRLNFNNFKAIGHSNGGLIYTVFLENYFDQYSNDVWMTKLMTIGSPFNFNERSIDNKTQMLSDFIKNRNKLPNNLSVYSVAGTKNYTSDGLVPLVSVAAGRYVFQGAVRHFTTITVSGSNAQHSDLPENKQIVDLINRYILHSTRVPRARQNEPRLH